METGRLLALSTVISSLGLGTLATCNQASDRADAGDGGRTSGRDATVSMRDGAGPGDGSAGDASAPRRCICPTGLAPDDAGTCSDGQGGLQSCRSPVLVGAYAENLPKLEEEIGSPLAMDLTHEGFVFGDAGMFGRGTPFTSLDEFAGDLDAGTIPILSVECLCEGAVDGVDGGDPGLLAGGIHSAAGLAAADLASQLAKYPGQILLRYCWEMNGAPPRTFCRPDNDAATHTNADVPFPEFIREWKALYEIMHPLAPNLAWFWCALNEIGSESSPDWYPRAAPGDPYCNYVDFAGWDDFDLDASGFATTARTAYGEYTSPDAGIGAPFIIGATGEAPDLQPEFINGDATPGILAAQFPRIVGINYFDVKLSHRGRSWAFSDAGLSAFGQFVHAEGQCPNCDYPAGLFRPADTCYGSLEAGRDP